MYEIYQPLAPGVGDGVAEGVVAGEVVPGGGGVADDVVGGVEEDLEFGVELAAAHFHDFHAAAEYCEFGGEGRREGFVLVVVSQRLQQMGHKGIDLVVGSGGVFGKFQHAHIGCLDVECDRAYVVIYIEQDVAGFALGVGHVGAYQSGKVTFHHFDQVAFLEVDVIEREVGETVLVGAGDIFEVRHAAVVDHRIPVLVSAVNQE